MKSRRVLRLGKAIADKGLIALHISIEFVSAKEQYKKLHNLLVHRIGKSTLGWHQIDGMGKPAVDVLPPYGSVVFEVWKHWLAFPLTLSPRVKPDETASVKRLTSASR